MTEANQKRSNSALWFGLLITILAVLSNSLYALSIPAAIIPWINLALPAVGLILLLIGVVRAFGKAGVYGGKIWGSIVTSLSVLLFALTVWLFFHARAVPASAGAPKVGQQIADFTLADSNGQPISLSQLLSGSQGNPQPKAVLLVFYRGYW